jgi:sporulation protein YlmC with PRC-barrel domain
MTQRRELNVESLFGTRVVDRDGRYVGRIEEVVAIREGTTCMVTAYLLGTTGLVGRFAAWRVARPLLHSLRGGGRHATRIPWDKLDLRDPARPRLTCARDELLG